MLAMNEPNPINLSVPKVAMKGKKRSASLSPSSTPSYVQTPRKLTTILPSSLPSTPLRPKINSDTSHLMSDTQLRGLVSSVMNNEDTDTLASTLPKQLLNQIISDNQQLIRSNEILTNKPRQSAKLESRARKEEPKPNLKCDKCGKTYSRRDNLIAHQRVHTDERPYSCSICPKSFRWMSALRHHEKMHRRRAQQNANKQQANTSQTELNTARNETETATAAAAHNSNTIPTLTTFNTNNARSTDSLELSDLNIPASNLSGNQNDPFASSSGINMNTWDTDIDFNYNFNDIPGEDISNRDTVD